MPLILTGTAASTTLDSSAGLTFSDSSNQSAAASPYVLKNRIINGAMVIDQRNAGASITPVNGGYFVDRFNYEATQTSKITSQQNQGSVTPPVGFSYYLGITSSSAYSVTSSDIFTIRHIIEGFNIADLAWGTANASPITISFWVRSSLTGTFGATLNNNGDTRNYPFTYTISVANTWEYKTITISGDTSGTWLTTNGRGLQIRFGLGVGSTYNGTAGSWSGTASYGATGATSVVGTNGATFYITGVQLEVGSTATPFERRMYGTELALCQRYYYRMTSPNTLTLFGVGSAWSATNGYCSGTFPVTMRTRPTALERSSTASHYSLETAGTARTLTDLGFASTTNSNVWVVDTYVASGQTAGQAGLMYGTSTSAYLGWSAEL